MGSVKDHTKFHSVLDPKANKITYAVSKEELNIIKKAININY